MKTKAGALSLAERVLLALAVCATTLPARATMTYDYTNAWMFDSATGLYWQVLPISTSTFIPSNGAVASYQQLETLGTEVGLPGAGLFAYLPGQPQQANPYSVPLANLLSFFQSDAPASAASQLRSLSITAVYQYPPDMPPRDFEYASFTYSPYVGNNEFWLYGSNTTLGTYGPGFPCPPLGTGCPSTEPAFVVSTVQPVPLPSAAWLMVSGLGAAACYGIALRRRGCTGV